MRVTDALGRAIELARPPQRIVCLVPSHTETLFALGAGDRVAGATDYCVHPEDGLDGVPRVGGTKNPSEARILELCPDLVIANKEENRPRTVERLEAAGVPVLVTYARTVDDAVRDLEQLGELVGAREQAAGIVQRIRAARSNARVRRPSPRPRVVALVWKRPYMAVGPDTFAHDLLVEAGARNAVAESEPPPESRYPRIDEAELRRLRPDVILLPTEPYAFDERDRAELLHVPCPAALDGRIHIVEGELLSWYGPRIARALDVLTGLWAR